MATKRQEFMNARTSWKFFERKRLASIHFRVKEEEALKFDVQLEILKELQYLNNK